MPSASRTHRWDDVSGHDVIVAYERLEPVLRGAIRAAVRSPMDYNVWVSTQADSSVSGVTDVRAVADRVGEPLDCIVVTARSDGATEEAADPIREVRLRIHYLGRANKVTLEVSGEDVPEVHGVFEAVRNQLTAEISRATGAGGPAVVRSAEPASPPTAATLERTEAAQPAPVARTTSRKRIGAFFSHPTGSNVAGGLIVATVLALLGWIWATYLR